MKEWQAYALAVFGVLAGQVLRVGQKIESGKEVTFRDLAVMFSLLPAFGSLIGAAATHFGWPTWMILIGAISAGWIGFATMRFVLMMAKNSAGQIMSSIDTDVDKTTKPKE